MIGIIASIAIPQFMRYRQRTLRAEAQTNLSAIQRSEKAYFAENGKYTDNLYRLGWDPTGSPNFIYGFKLSIAK